MSDWIKARAAEPSTWRGLGLLLVAGGLLPVGAVDVVVTTGMAVMALVEVVRSEKK